MCGGTSDSSRSYGLVMPHMSCVVSGETHTGTPSRPCIVVQNFLSPAILALMQGLDEGGGCHLTRGILAARNMCGLQPTQSAQTHGRFNFTPIIKNRLSCRPEQHRAAQWRDLLAQLSAQTPYLIHDIEIPPLAALGRDDSLIFEISLAC